MFFTYDSSYLPSSTSASDEIWIPRPFFPPSRRIVKQAASALYFEAFTASTEPRDCDIPVSLTARRLLAVGPAVYQQTTTIAMSRNYTTFDLVSKSQWTCLSFSNVADAFVHFYTVYESHVRRPPIDLVDIDHRSTPGESDSDKSKRCRAVVNASASSEPLLVPYNEEDAEAVKTNGFVRHLTNWCSDLWSAIALKCETALDVQPFDIPTVALGAPKSSWNTVIEGGLLHSCVELLLSVSSDPEDVSTGRVCVPESVIVLPTFVASAAAAPSIAVVLGE